ncbi:hypothetical protein KUV62_17940 [Salipiger bermudensis]|nr:hypothetical protein [Salipiger bermudensis]
MSAIDWLDGSDSNAPSVLRPSPLRNPQPFGVPLDEPPVASSVQSPEVESAPLGQPTAEAVGLLPMSVTGLPRSLWRNSEVEILAELIERVDPAVPALSALLFTLLLAEADAPIGSGEGAPLLAARLDRLIEEGAVDPGLALIERAGGATSPDLFARWFDLALLADSPDAPCRVLQRQPQLSDDLAARVFCDARNGRWDHAVTVLGTADALDQISDRDAELLIRFVEPELVDESNPVPPPAQPTPLQFRLFEAVGETLPTQPLPRAFAAADLSGTSGWRAQLLAAERLAAHGALSANRLLGLYSERRPAASGGVWDRVAAVQALDSALTEGREDLIGPALITAWGQMRSAGLLVPFSELFGERLSTHQLDGRAGRLAQRAALLSPGYESAARALGDGASGRLNLAAAIAKGAAPEPLPESAFEAAVARAWDDPTPPAELARRLQQGKLGEVILRSMALFETGAAGNHQDLTEALATLRAVGLEDTARRAAIELLILEDEGALR